MAPLATFEDHTLIEMALAGQSACFSALMDRHVTAVRKCIRSVVTNTSDVDEIVQDAFFKAWVHLSKFRFEASFRTWITRVALNESLTLYRRQRCRPFTQRLEIWKLFRQPVNHRTSFRPARKYV